MKPWSMKNMKSMKNDKYMWTAKVGERGQIVIPKEAREVFNINFGDSLILFGDIKRGIAIAKYENYSDFVQSIFDAQNKK
jgi:AbrB family looped-hinge helix DNA binding protein